MAVKWYLRLNGKEHGPFSSAELKKLAQQCRITASTEVRREEDGTWVTASRVKGLLDAAPDVTAASPPPRPAVSSRTSSLEVPPSESAENGTPKWIWGLVSVAVVVIAGLSVFFVIAEKRRGEERRIASANAAVSKAVDDARVAIAAGDFDKADHLVRDAIANEDATEKSAAVPMQDEIRKSRTAVQAKTLLTDAQRSIQARNIKTAIESLTKIVAIEGMPDDLRSTAKQLLSEAETAISEQCAKKALMQLSDSQFTAFLASQKLPAQYCLNDPALHQLFLELCLASKDQIQQARERSQQQQTAATAGAEIRRYECANFTPTNIAISPNRKQLACPAHKTNTIHVWDIESGQQLLALSPPAKHSLDYDAATSFSSDGKHLVAYVAKDRGKDEPGLLSFPNIGVWEVSTGRFVRFVEGVQEVVGGTDFYSCVAATTKYVLAGGRCVVSGEKNDFPVRVWDINTGRLVHSLLNHRESVNCLAVSPDGDYLVSGGVDRVAILWEIATGREIRLFDAHESSVLCATFSPDGKSLLTGSRDCTARLWEVTSGKELHQWVLAPYNASEDAKSLADFKANTALANARGRGQIIAPPVGPVGSVVSVDFSPGGNTALVGLYVLLPQAMTNRSNPVLLNIESRQVVAAPSAFAARRMSTVRALFNSDGTAALLNKSREERVRGENMQVEYLSLVGLPVASDPSTIGGGTDTSIKSIPKAPTIRGNTGPSPATASEADNPNGAKVVNRTTGEFAWGKQSVASMSNGDEIIERSTLAGRIVVKSLASKGVFKEKHVFGGNGDELFSMRRGVDGNVELNVNDTVGTASIRISNEAVDGRQMRVRVRNLSGLEIGEIEFEADLLDSTRQVIISNAASIRDLSSQSAKDVTLILADADLVRAEAVKFRLKKVEMTIEKVDADVTEWFRVDEASK